MKRTTHTTLGSLFALLSVATACSATSPEPLDSTQQALYANDEVVYKYFVDKGLTNFQAAGVVGNLDQESNVDPTIHQYNGGVGRGLAQWSAGARWDTTPGDNVKDFAQQQGKDIYDLGLQLDFIWFELNNFENYGLAELKASTTLEQATQVFEDKFEGCVYANYPECALPSRVTYAKAVFAAFGDYTGPTGMGGSGGTGSGGGGAGGTAGSDGGGAGAGGAGAGGVAAGGVAGSTASGGTGGAAGGAPGTAGTPSSAGSNTVAGANTAPGAAGTSTVMGLPSTSDDSSCSFAPTRVGYGTRGFIGAALALMLGARRRRRAC